MPRYAIMTTEQLARIARRNRDRGRRDYCHNPPAGTVERLAATIKKLEAAGITPEEYWQDFFRRFKLGRRYRRRT